MFRLEAVQKRYRIGAETIEAVSGVSLRVETGEYVAIVGHSGSGKSTLLSISGGLTRPSGGRVWLDGEDLWAMDDDGRARLRNRRIGFVFQFASLLPTLTGLGNVLLPRVFDPLGVRAEDGERARELLALVGMSDKAYAYPGELSGGQQRRVAIARALINRPALILADEPTGDLDEASEAEVMDLLLGTARSGQAALVLVTHNLHLTTLADRVHRMKQGTLQ